MSNKTDSEGSDLPNPEYLQQILQRAEQGDQSVLPELRQVLDSQPELWQRCSDVARNAESKILDLVAGTNLLLAESLRKKLEAMRAELVGEMASPLERQLIDRVVTCWLYSTYLDTIAIHSTASFSQRANDVQKWQDGAHRRHLAAVQLLATIRRKLGPSRSPNGKGKKRQAKPQEPIGLPISRASHPTLPTGEANTQTAFTQPP